MKTSSRLALVGDLYRRAGLRGLIGAGWSAYDYYAEPGVVRGSPLFLQIEPTILCNLECAFCINPFLPRSRTSLSLAKFQKILEQCPSVSKISLVGIGESFMNRELWSIIRHARSRGITIGTTSNGTFLTDRIFAEIFDSGLDWLNFSLDGATKATYEKMRPGAIFEDVLANITRVATRASELGRPPLAVWFLTTRQNVAELPMMVDLVKELGISRLNTQGVHYWGHEDWHGRAQEANAIPELRDTLVEVARLARAAGIVFEAVNFQDLDAGRGCKWPWKGSYITADGFVTPCCENGSDPHKINFGNVFETPYAEIWNSPAYQKFREELSNPAARPSICKDCPSYHKTLKI
jgi:radical SAM protein with 4Fe4S-binding SPASM domain